MLPVGDDMPEELRGELERGERIRIVDPREVPVRFSRLKSMAQSPLHYWHSVQGRDQEGDTLSRRLGSGGHAVLLDQPVAVFQGKVRRGKEWNAFKEGNPGKTLLNRKEHAQATAMADAIRRSRTAMWLLFGVDGDRCHVEEQIEWTWMGRKCSSRPDSWNHDRVVELKTTKSSEPRQFIRQAINLFYHGQHAFYHRALRESGLASPRDSYIVAVESAPPYAVTNFHLTPNALEMGAKLCRTWFEQVLVCEASQSWPPYSLETVSFDVEDDRFVLQVDGEEVSFDNQGG
jgi:hypothetical protein